MFILALSDAAVVNFNFLGEDVQVGFILSRPISQSPSQKVDVLLRGLAGDTLSVIILTVSFRLNIFSFNKTVADNLC